MKVPPDSAMLMSRYRWNEKLATNEAAQASDDVGKRERPMARVRALSPIENRTRRMTRIRGLSDQGLPD